MAQTLARSPKIHLRLNLEEREVSNQASRITLTFIKGINEEEIRGSFVKERRVIRERIIPRENEEGRFFRSLTRHRPKNPRVQPKSLKQLKEYEQELDDFLEQELEKTTWEGYASVWTEFEQFTIRMKEEPSDRMAAIWLLSLLQDKERISLQGVYQYAKKLSAVVGRLPDADTYKDGDLKAFKAVCVKMGARIPTHQAEPILKEEVYRTVSDERIPMDFRVELLLAWKSASRADDLQSLNVDDIVFTTWEGRKMIVLRWLPKIYQGTSVLGRMKNDRCGLGKSCVVDAGEWHVFLKEGIQKRKGAFMKRTTETFSNLLKKYTNQRLTGHSPKRGALEYLLNQHVPLHLVTEMARHATTSSLPMVTRLYLSSVTLALRLETQQATKLL